MARATINEVRGMVSSGAFSVKQEKKFDYTPLFLPVATEGKPVMKVTARHDFINNSLKEWRLFHITRTIAVVSAIGALVLLPINAFASAGAGIIAGWFYGEHLKKNFFINKMLKQRDMLEST